jgi:hypothetical protein
MTSPIRTRLSTALAAFALATLSLPAMAQSWMAEGPLDTPNFLEAWNEDADVVPAVAVGPAEDAPVRIKTQRPDPEAAEPGVKVVNVVEEEQPKPRRLPVMIDQYPQNPRCYVAGRYVPAPPLCPN